MRRHYSWAEFWHLAGNEWPLRHYCSIDAKCFHCMLGSLADKLAFGNDGVTYIGG